MANQSRGRKRKDLEREKKNKKRTGCSRTLKQDLFSGNHCKSSAHILMNGVAELGPGTALDGPFAESGFGELSDPGRGSDLDLVAFIVELVLDHLLDPILVGSDHLTRWQQEIQVLSVVFVKFSPSEFTGRFRSRTGSFKRHDWIFEAWEKNWDDELTMMSLWKWFGIFRWRNLGNVMELNNTTSDWWYINSDDVVFGWRHSWFMSSRITDLTWKILISSDLQFNL